MGTRYDILCQLLNKNGKFHIGYIETHSKVLMICFMLVVDYLPQYF